MTSRAARKSATRPRSRSPRPGSVLVAPSPQFTPGVVAKRDITAHGREEAVCDARVALHDLSGGAVRVSFGSRPICIMFAFRHSIIFLARLCSLLVELPAICTSLFLSIAQKSGLPFLLPACRHSGFRAKIEQVLFQPPESRGQPWFLFYCLILPTLYSLACPSSRQSTNPNTPHPRSSALSRVSSEAETSGLLWGLRPTSRAPRCEHPPGLCRPRTCGTTAYISVICVDLT